MTPGDATTLVAQYIWAQRIPVQPWAPIVAPHVVTLRVAVAPEAVGGVVRSADAIRAVLGSNRARVYAEGKVVHVEMPRKRSGGQAPVLPIPLGIDTHNRRRAVELHHRHLVLAGITGAGKSFALRRIALEAARQGAQLALADLDKGTWDGFEQAEALVSAVARGPAAGDALAAMVAGLIDSREIGQLPHLVLIIDEVDLLGKAGHEAVKQIANFGRKVNICGVFATRILRRDTIDRLVSLNADVRIAGRMRDGTASRSIIGTGDAVKLSGRGDVLVDAGGDIARVYIEPVTDAELELLPRREGAVPDLAVAGEVEAAEIHPGHIAADNAPLVEWARREGVTSARAIQRQRGIGMDRARQVRDAVLGVTPLLAYSGGSGGASSLGSAEAVRG